MAGLAFLKTWKFWLLLVVIGSVVSGGYFAVKSYRDMASKNVKLEQAVQVSQAQVKALQDTLQGISDATDRNTSNTNKIIEKTQIIEKRISNAPITKDCIQSPSIAIAIDQLRSQAHGDNASASKVP